MAKSPSERIFETTMKLGGPQRIIECDESLFFKRKNDRGRIRPPLWVLGCIERGTPKTFMKCVYNDRSAASLLPIIEEHVEDGSIIMTDGFLYSL